MKQNEVDFNGKTYISSKRASEMTGYTNDYIGQLARAGKIKAKMIGRTWFVETDSILKHKIANKLKYEQTPPLPSKYVSHLPSIPVKQALATIGMMVAALSFAMGATLATVDQNTRSAMKEDVQTFAYATKDVISQYKRNAQYLTSVYKRAYTETGATIKTASVKTKDTLTAAKDSALPH